MDLTNKQNAYIFNNPQVPWVLLNTDSSDYGSPSPLIIVNSDCASLQPGVAPIKWGNWSDAWPSMQDVSIADCSILPYPTAS